MELNEVLTQARDTITVKRVFGEAYERDGIMVIPVARVMGGAGGGGGETAGSERAEGREGLEGGPKSTGSGAGFGVMAAPAGAYVIREGEVRWLPAVDVNRIVLGAQIVAVIALLVARSILRSWRQR